jgi:hypothetical protein
MVELEQVSGAVDLDLMGRDCIDGDRERTGCP